MHGNLVERQDLPRSQRLFAYYSRMVKDEGRINRNYTTKTKLGVHARFVGSAAVALADGSMEDEFFPIIRGPRAEFEVERDGSEFRRKWKIVNPHLSSNVFTNSLITALTRSPGIVGSAVLVTGLLAGCFRVDGEGAVTSGQGNVPVLYFLLLTFGAGGASCTGCGAG
jgi:hypothetical protein